MLEDSTPSDNPIEDALAALHGNPVTFLRCLRQMMRQRDRAMVGWDAKALFWMSKAWGEAAIASLGHPERDEMLRLRDYYKHLGTELDREIAQRRDFALVHFESKDWPHQRVIQRAILCLCHAEINAVIH